MFKENVLKQQSRTPGDHLFFWLVSDVKYIDTKIPPKSYFPNVKFYLIHLYFYVFYSTYQLFWTACNLKH